jgi:homoserine dehydrogenase
MREVGIGVAGFGTVGGGVLSILERHAREIEARLGARIVVRKVLLRDRAKARAVEVAPGVPTTRMADLLEDPRIEVVVELIGGTGEAFDLVKGALERGKHVVTANKALLAEHGAEVIGEAERAGVDVYFDNVGSTILDVVLQHTTLVLEI